MTTIFSMIWSFLLLAQTAATQPALVPATDSPATDSPAIAEPVPAGFQSGRADFVARFGDQELRYAEMAVFALPGEEIPLAVDGSTAFTAEATHGVLTAAGPNRWTWRPADSGATATLTLRDPQGHAMTLHALTLVPYAEMKNGKVRGYPVGPYPQPTGRRAAHSQRPRGFVEVTEANQDLLVSPHFRLAQFVCKEGAGFPKYIVLQPVLLDRLETLLAKVNENGFEASTFEVMSAYRTPRYNKAIGNKTSFTRHQYGDAADVYVDVSPVDGRMDDLNKDGRHDKQDALALHEWAEELEGTPEAGGRPGGLSAYGSTHSHGPFVHVDTRGYAARW